MYLKRDGSLQQASLVIVIGRQVVLEVLAAPRVEVREVLIAADARGAAIDVVAASAERQGVAVRRLAERRLDQLAGDDRRHQGVIAEIEPPTPISVEAFASQRAGRRWPTNALALDQVHNPANVGMILRTTAAAGIDGVVLPRVGTAGIGPLVLKAGSGVVFANQLVDAATTADALDALLAESFAVVAVDANGADLFTAELPERAVYVLGNETVGISAEASGLAQLTVSLPLANGVESLNVAAAAAVLSYELVRRRSVS